MSRKGFPSIMREVVWLLLPFLWLVQGQLGPSTSTTAGATGSPSPANSEKCPESNAWDEHAHGCVPCSVCISYPKSPFCYACPEFNQAPAAEAVPDFETEDGDGQSSSQIHVPLLIWGPTAICLVVLVSSMLIIIKLSKANKRKKQSRREVEKFLDDMSDIQPSERMLDLHGASCKLIVLTGPPRSTLSTVTSMHGRPLPINTIAQMQKKSVNFVSDRNTSDSESDSDISNGETETCSSTAHSASIPSNSVIQMSQREEESCAESTDSVHSKSNIATSCCNSIAFFVEALIGKDGGILSLLNAETSLLISPHSISNQIDITLEILHHLVVLPDLGEDETLVSPIVCCGPHGWTFHKPVCLTFPHCSMSDKKDFTLLVSETSSQQVPDWVEVSNAAPGIEYFVRDNECLVYTTHFTGYTLMSRGPKQVRLLAFSSISDNLYRLRIHCINDTKDAIDRIRREEQEFGFKLTDWGIAMTFLNNKKDIHLKADLETPGWKFLNSSQELVISYDSVRGKRDGNVMFNLQAEPDLKGDKRVLSLSIHASQEGNSDSPTYSVAEVLPIGKLEMTNVKSLQLPSHNRCDHRGACNCARQPNQAKVSFLNTLGSSCRNLTIPHKLRMQLCIKLDPPKECGGDWRSLASDLGLDELIEYFGSKGNPTELLLQEFDKSGKTLKDLWAILIGIRRPDVASLVDEHIQTTSCKLPSTFSDSGMGRTDTDREVPRRHSTSSSGSDTRFFPNGPSRAGESFEAMSKTDPQQHVHCGRSVPLQDLYNSSQDAVSQTNSPQFLHCGGSIPSEDLYNSSQDASSQTSSRQYLHCGGSVPSRDLYKSSQDAMCISQTSSPQYVHCGGSIPSNKLYNSCATEPKLIEATGNMQALALNVNSTDRDNDELGNGEAQEKNGIGTDDSLSSLEDIQQSTKVMVVPSLEVRGLPDGRRETEV